MAPMLNSFGDSVGEMYGATVGSGPGLGVVFGVVMLGGQWKDCGRWLPAGTNDRCAAEYDGSCRMAASAAVSLSEADDLHAATRKVRSLRLAQPALSAVERLAQDDAARGAQGDNRGVMRRHTSSPSPPNSPSGMINPSDAMHHAITLSVRSHARPIASTIGPGLGRSMSASG